MPLSGPIKLVHRVRSSVSAYNAVEKGPRLDGCETMTALLTVGVLVALAVLATVWQLFRSASGKGGCGGCGCHSLCQTPDPPAPSDAKSTPTD